MKVSVRDYREGLGVGSETCWSEKLIGSKPWQALEFRLCMSHFQSASLPNWLSNWRKQRTHYFVLVFRLFAAFFSLTLSLTLPLFFSVSFPFCFISSLPALPSLPHHFSVCFSVGYSLLPHNPSVWAWLNWTVDISKVDKCPSKITRNHSAFHPHETTFFPTVTHLLLLSYKNHCTQRITPLRVHYVHIRKSANTVAFLCNSHYPPDYIGPVKAFTRVNSLTSSPV